MWTRIDKVMPWLFPVFVMGILVVYYFVNPSLDTFPIKCVWKELTHTDCPACGMQRAMFALVHGELRQALAYNYFFILSIPYAMMAVVTEWYNYHHLFDGVKRVVYHPTTLKIYVLLYCLWWIIRNII